MEWSVSLSILKDELPDILYKIYTRQDNKLRDQSKETIQYYEDLARIFELQLHIRGLILQYKKDCAW